MERVDRGTGSREESESTETEQDEIKRRELVEGKRERTGSFDNVVIKERRAAAVSLYIHIYNHREQARKDSISKRMVR